MVQFFAEYCSDLRGVFIAAIKEDKHKEICMLCVLIIYIIILR
jgi:hypothetical protein